MGSLMFLCLLNPHIDPNDRKEIYSFNCIVKLGIRHIHILNDIDSERLMSLLMSFLISLENRDL